MTPPAALSPLALAHLASVYLVWGSTYLAIRFGVAVWPPFVLGTVRFLVAGLGMLAAAKILGHKLALDRRSAVTCLITGFFLFVFGNGAVLLAEQTTSSGLVAILIATTPIWMTLAAWLLGTGRRPSLRVVLSFVLGLSGVGALVVNGGTVTPPNVLLLMLGSAVWASASVWMAKRDPQGSLLVRSAYEMLAGGAGFLALALGHGDLARLGPAMLAPAPLLSVAYLIVFGSCVGFVSFTWVVGNLPPHLAGSYAFVNPVVAVFLGALFGERLTPQALLATVLVVAGVALAAIEPGKQAASQVSALLE